MLYRSKGIMLYRLNGTSFDLKAVAHKTSAGALEVQGYLQVL